jgi:hypothetical protein
MLVIADGDVWTDPRSVSPAVAKVRAGVRLWAVPQLDVRRLTEGAPGRQWIRPRVTGHRPRADQILESMADCCKRINDSRH